MGDRSYLSIGDVLALLREEFPDITISKIRFLESRGLLVPERTPSGYRKFYDHDVDRLRWILRQQREHFLPLKVIKGRLEGQVPSSEPAALFEVQEVEARHAGASAPPQSVSDGVLEPALAVNGSHAVLEAAAAQPSAAVMARPGHSASTVQAPAAGLIPPRPQVPTSTHTPVGSTPPGAGPAIPASAGPVAASAGASTSGPSSSPPASSGTASPGALAGKAEAHSRPSAGASVPGISGAAAPTGAHEDAAPGPARASHRPHSAAPTHAEAARAAAVGGVPASPAPGPPPGAPGQAASSAHGSAPGASGDSGAGHAGHGPTAPPAGLGAPTTRASAGHAAATSSAPSSVSRDRGDGPSDPAASMAGGRPPEAASLSGASLTAAELAQASGLDADQVAELESYGLIESRAVAGVSCYDENALVVAGLAASFARFGVEARHLKLFKHAAERQASLYSQVVMPLLRQRNPDARRRAHDDLTRLTELGASMQACFAKAVLRNLTRG